MCLSVFVTSSDIPHQRPSSIFWINHLVHVICGSPPHTPASWACLSCLHCKVKDTFTTSAKHHVELRAALGFVVSINRNQSTEGFHTEENTDCVCVKEPVTGQGHHQVALCRLALSNRVFFNHESLPSDCLHAVAPGHEWLLGWNVLVYLRGKDLEFYLV